MKNFKSFALLGAVLVASASAASATPFSGELVLSGYGAYIQSGGVATLSSPNSGLNNYNFSSPSLGNFLPGTITFDAFSTASISSATPVTIFSILDGSDTLSFVATGFGPLGASSSSSNGSVDLTGYFHDSSALFTNTVGTVDVSSNGSTTLAGFTEDAFATAPEPSSLILLGTGLVWASALFFRRQRRAI